MSFVPQGGPRKRRKTAPGFGRATAAPARPPAFAVLLPSTASSFTLNRTWVVWGYATLTAPAPTLGATAAPGKSKFVGVAPSATLQAYAGGFAQLRAPKPTLSITATIRGIGVATLTAPAPVMSTAATSTGWGDAALTFGSLLGAYKVVGYSGAVCSVSIAGMSVGATGTGGALGSAALTLPLFELVASGTTRGLSSADLLCPAPGLAGVGVAWLIAPTAALVAIGTATVTTTYEAYAVNLNHQPRRGVEPVDETTRYTNFAFDRIVRYKNSYFGMAADGLYLLEGTTDYASPTPTPVTWAIKSAMTDFGSAQLKTPESIYFSGRFGATNVTMYAGEGSGTQYSYPRPATAAARNHRQVLGRGVKARYFAFGATGADVLELDDVDFSVAKMTRRI